MVWQSAESCRVPAALLIMVGSDDQLVDADAVIAFGQKANNKTTLKVWDGGYHELHNEPFKMDVLQTMTDWINQIL